MPANNSNTPLIGIDFGTTKTMAACFDQSKGQTILLKLGLRGYEIPTSIYQTAEGRTFYGEEADEEGVSDHINYIHRFKMKLGQPGPAHFGRMTRTAEQLASDFLSHVRATLKSEVLHSKEDSDLERAVLTIPAIFGRAQQNELKRAAETAGFTQVVLLPEPVAAGIAYCDHHAVKGSLRFLVVDWGGGTFDVALMEREEDGSIRIIPEFVGGLDGINHGDNIGGEFMDDLLFQATSHALTNAGFQGLDRQDPMMWGKYKRDITRAKERLSSREEMDVPFVLDGGTPAKVKFERSTLEPKNVNVEGTLNETVMAGARFVEGLLQRCRDGGCPPEFILLAGGTSRMPMVKRVFEETLKIDCRTWTQGREAISLGAALRARNLWGSTETKRTITKPTKSHNPDSSVSMEAGKSKKQKDAVVERRAAADKAKMEAAAAGSATADFMKLVQPDDKLAVIVGAKPLPRTELTKKLWTYIKKHGLQDEKVRTQINADDALKAVFNGKKSVSMFEMTALLSGHVKSTETNNPKKPFSTPTYGDRKSSEPKPRPKPRPKPKKPEAVWETIGRWIFGSKW